MKCPRCQYENRPQAKFCEECATPLSRVCSSCSAPLSPTAKFCPECAQPVAAGGAQPDMQTCRGYCLALRFDLDFAFARFAFALRFDFAAALAVEPNAADTAATGVADADAPGSFMPVSWNSTPSCEKRKRSPLCSAKNSGSITVK